MKFLESKKGFSLIELMVVVAIIGVLAMIAVPGYQTFQSRARQKEGFALLDAFFVAAQATRAEFGVYPGNLVQTGFAPTGQLGYRLRSEDGTDINIGFGINANACIDTNQACNCAAACPLFKTWAERPLGAIGTTIGPQTVLIACPPLAASSTTDSTFSVRIGGVISVKAAAIDRYGMDETKRIAMCSDGLK